MTVLLLPPARRALDRPLLFLAGPIQGAADWQAEAVALLQEEDIIIANPRRPGPFGRDELVYEEQVRWEHEHLAAAARAGVILFWLAREASHDCQRAFAQTTRFELGEAVTLARLGQARVVVGIEPGFTGERYIRLTVADKAPQIKLAGDLAAACRLAAGWLRRGG